MKRSTTLSRRLGRRTIIAAVAVTMVVGAVGQPSLADPAAPPGKEKVAVAPGAPEEPAPAGFATWDELWTEQARLGTAADQVSAAGEREAGYAGIIVDPQRHEVRLHWHGAVPAHVESALAAARTTASVRLIAAPYSRAVLDADIDRWLASGQVSGGAANEDGSGIELTVQPGGRAADLAVPAGAVAPFTVADTGPVTAHWDRSDDTPAYWGGGRISLPTYKCTAGWSVRDRNGQPAMLTAAHCGNVGDTVYDGGGSGDLANYMGYVSERDTIRDSMLVHAARPLGPRVFLGSPTTTESLPVAGWVKIYVGDWVCTNGAKTGRHCNIRATKTNYSGTMTSGQYVKHMVVAKHQAGGCAVAGGDSGGPVLTYGSSALSAGTITGGMGVKFGCGYGTTDGQHTVVFPRTPDVLAQFGATLL